jgi:hypothetical protein
MGNSSPAWLAKDLAAQKHLGKLYQDADKSLWFVQALDTGRQGDVAHLERWCPRTVEVTEGGRKPVARRFLGFTGERRIVPLVRLERDYTVVPS